MKLKLGQKLIARTFGVSQKERDAVMGAAVLLYSPMASDEMTVTRLSEHNAWLTDGSGFTRRVAHQVIECGLMHGHTVKATTWFSGPFEVVDHLTPDRDALWAREKRNKEEFESLRFALARASVGAQ